MATSKALKFAPHLKELRIHLCQKGEASKGVRDFVEKHYVGVKKNNPKFPILIRECSGVKPRMFARYEMGKESSMSLDNMDADKVLQTMETLAQKS